MKQSCTRRLQFCAGHRVKGHENKCAHLHGHNYVVHLTAEAQQLDGIGRVIDFSVLKKLFGDWIDFHWDHGFIVWDTDADAIEVINAFSGLRMGHGQEPQKLYKMPSNPTAENMAQHLLEVIAPQLLKNTGITITKVRILETENCSATAEL